MAPLISVVMPHYNGAAFLENSLRSLLSQSFHDFEILILDTGSTDGGKGIAIAKKYAASDPRFRVYELHRQGLVNGLNVGCELSKGKYIARLDCDDLALPNRFELQVTALEANNDLVLVGGQTACIDSYNNYLFTMNWPTRINGLRELMLVDCCIAHTTVMFRKLQVAKLGGYRAEYVHAEDYDLFLRLCDLDIADNLQQVLSCYRIHAQQTSGLSAYQQIISAFGARLSSRARRAGKPEPLWASAPVTEQDILLCGIDPRRIALSLDSVKTWGQFRAAGWRWHRLNLHSSQPLPDEVLTHLNSLSQQADCRSLWRGQA